MTAQESPRSATGPDQSVLDAARLDLDERGWAQVEGLLDADRLNMFSSEVSRIIAETQTGVTATSAAVDDGVLVINSLDAASEILFDFARTDYMMGLAETFLGKRAQPIHIEFFGKPAPGSPPTPPHQDQIFYNDHFDDEPAVTFWCPLEDVSHDSGCLEYGTPYPAGTLLPHRQSDALDFGAQLTDDSSYTYTPVAVSAGDCLVHTAYVVHRSGPMRSSRPRRVLAFNYRGSSYREMLRTDARPE